VNVNVNQVHVTSPVVHSDGRRGVVVGLIATGGPDGTDLAPDVAWVAWRDDVLSGLPAEQVPVSDLALDLTDKTGRAHAAWWLAERLGLEALRTGVVAIRLQDVADYSTDGQALALETKVVWALGDERYDIGTPEVLAALADLDPHDPRLLEDGSRWVDAEALRLVCLHVAGGGQ